MSFSFIHTGDIHLGRSFKGLSEYLDDSDVNYLYKNAIKKAFNNLINFALNKDVDFVLIAGDTFDSTEQDFESKIILKEGLLKLEKAGIKVYLITGNHDPLNSYSKNTFNFNKDSIIKIIGLNTDTNKFIIEDKLNNPIACLQAVGFQDNTFSGNILDNLSCFSDEEKKLFDIALLHCDLDASQDSPYAPCSKKALEDFNFDYCALGHIHLVETDKNSKIQYCGTLQGRNTKETGAHGIRYIKAENKNITENTFIPLDVIRYVDIELDLTGLKDITEASDYISKNVLSLAQNNCELYLVRVNLCGNVDFYDEINDIFYETLSENIKLESSKKIYISKFNNTVIPKINDDILKDDTGISGQLYNTVNNEEALEKAFLSVVEENEKILKNCAFDENELRNFKEEILQSAKKTCLSACNLMCCKIGEDN